MTQETDTLHVPVKPFSISADTTVLLVGDDAHKALKNLAFQEKWDLLYAACPWATVFQGREFVTSWCHFFRKEYTLLLAVSEEGNQLTGMLVMALQNKGRKKKEYLIVAAGDGEADSQSWLSTEARSDTFIKEALTKISDRFPDNNISFWNVSPGTPLQWAENSPEWKQKCSLQPTERPLINMQDFSLSRRDRKRINALGKLGSFEVVKDLDSFKDIVGELGIHHDFRQGAMFNKLPFGSNPHYKPFLIELFKRDVITVTLFRSREGEMIAALAAAVGKDKAHLGGILFHSPRYAQYSPGIVHFMLTAQHFAGTGIAYFDLTPGGDPYKARLATAYDTTHNLVVTNNRFYLWKKQLRNKFYKRLSERGWRPLSLLLSLARQKYLIRHKGLLGRAVSLLRANLGKTKYECYKLNKGELASPAMRCELHKNSVNDLLLYRETRKDLTRWEFLEDAMRRFEQGDQLYSCSVKGELRHCAWLLAEESGQQAAAEYGTAAGALYLSNLYSHPDANGSFYDFMGAVAADLAQSFDPEKPIYTIVDRKDKKQRGQLRALSS